MLITDLGLVGMSCLGQLSFKEKVDACRKLYDWEKIKKFPTKNSPLLTTLLIKKYTDIGDRVCDPMDGIGTTIIEAVLLGRCGYSFNISQERINTIVATLDRLSEQYELGYYRNIYAPGNHIREFLAPYTMDLILFSPPYGRQCHKMGDSDGQKALRARKKMFSCQEYGNDTMWDLYDVSKARNLKAFYAGMVGILRGSCDCLKAGGHMCIILQDYVRKGKPVGLVQGFIDLIKENEPDLTPVGYWERLTPVTMFKQMQIKKGNNVIGVEHTLVYRKEPVVPQGRK